MVELPEVEVLRRDLEREVVGKKVKAVDVKTMAALAHYKNRKAFSSLLEGTKFCSVARKGVRVFNRFGRVRKIVECEILKTLTEDGANFL